MLRQPVVSRPLENDPETLVLATVSCKDLQQVRIGAVSSDKRVDVSSGYRGVERGPSRTAGCRLSGGEDGFGPRNQSRNFDSARQSLGASRKTYCITLMPSEGMRKGRPREVLCEHRQRSFRGVMDAI